MLRFRQPAYRAFAISRSTLPWSAICSANFWQDANIKTELAYFFAALRFFTRLPVPAWVGHSAEQLNHASRYFPLVGIVIGLIGAAVTWLAFLVLPVTVAIAIGMAATLIATGAFHEDGFADSCDGFGGGWDKPRILAIMKDSRIGSYGAIGIGLLLLTKWNSLIELDAQAPWLLLAGLVAAHAASRFAATTLIYALDYVRDEDSKAKPLATRMSGAALSTAALFGVLPCLILPWPQALMALLLLGVSTLLCARYFVSRIGGYTGDCLGACQQIGELSFYLGLLMHF